MATEYASIGLRHNKLNLDLRRRLSALRAQTLACATCGEPAVSIRSGSGSCALCTRIAIQRRQVALMREAR